MTFNKQWGKDARLAVTSRVLHEVLRERDAQDRRWGQQDFPFHHEIDGDGTYLMGRPYTGLERMFKDACDSRRALAQGGGPDTRSNALVLLEEVFEALAETDPAKAREEMVQVAAVAVKVIEAMDRAATEAALSKAVDLTGAVSALMIPEVPTEDQLRFLSSLEPATVHLELSAAPFGEAPDEVTVTYSQACPRCRGTAIDPDDSGTEGIGPELRYVPEPCRECSLSPVDDDRPHRFMVAEARRIMGTPGATVDQVAEAGAVLRRAEESGIRPDSAPLADVLRHPYNGAGRLHGICRCGGGPDDDIHRTRETE